MRHQDLNAEVDGLSRRVIGAAIEVHRHLGPGFLESVYHNALCYELSDMGIAYVREAPVRVTYKGRDAGEGRIDLVVGADELIVELKAVDALHPVHDAQVMSYLKSTGIRLGLLMNFRAPKLKEGLRRIIL